jgi:predicted DNA-binding transcriptional regulator AlpA
MPSRSRPDHPATDNPAPDPLPVLSEAADDLGLIYKPELIEIVGLCFVTIWGLVRQHRFPQPRVLAGKTCWLRGEIAQWLQALPRREYKQPDVVEEEREHPLAARRRRSGRQRREGTR